jgi:5-(carboxyamino)imidazole ribonucleotide synthase
MEKPPLARRKLGHVTVLIHTENGQNIEEKAKAIADKIELIWYP